MHVIQVILYYFLFQHLLLSYLVLINLIIFINLQHNLIKITKNPIIYIFNLHKFFNNFLTQFFLQKILYQFYQILKQINLFSFNSQFQQPQNESDKQFINTQSAISKNAFVYYGS